MQPDRFFEQHRQLKVTMRSILTAKNPKKTMPVVTSLLEAFSNFIASDMTAILYIHGIIVSDQDKIISIFESMLSDRNVNISNVKYYDEDFDVRLIPSDACLICLKHPIWNDSFFKYMKRHIENLN